MTTNRALVSAWFVSEDRDTPYDGSRETANPLRERTAIRVYLLTADVRLGARWGVQATTTIPDITRSASVTLASGETIEFSENFRGVGDTSVIAWKRLPVRRGWNVTINGGVSLPTGRTEMPRFGGQTDEGSLVPLSRLQRGSGTFDPLAGISANRLVSSIFPPGVRVFASAAARVPLAENEHGLRTGASWEVNAGASREVIWHNVIAIGRLGWLHREQDSFEGTPVLVGGGDWLNLSPAVALSVGKWTLQAEARVPLMRSLSNRQLDSAYGLQFGVVRAF